MMPSASVSKKEMTQVIASFCISFGNTHFKLHSGMDVHTRVHFLTLSHNLASIMSYFDNQD